MYMNYVSETAELNAAANETPIIVLLTGSL